MGMPGMDGCHVMQSGFQTARNFDSFCVLFLFPGWNIDNDTKYTLSVIGVFLMAFANEFLTYMRHRVRVAQQAAGQAITLKDEVVMALLYGAHMTMAYFIMLLVMLYESLFFGAIICGFIAGHFVFNRIKAREAATMEGSVNRMGLSTRLIEAGRVAEGSPCCGGAGDI